MVKVPDVERKSIAGRTLIGLAAIAAMFTVLTLWIVFNITHNIYISGYYTISSLFDALGINTSTVLQSVAPVFSANFDILVLISIADGVVKVISVGLALAALVEIITGTSILSKLNIFEARRLDGHAIVCGYSRLGERVCDELSERKIKFVVIERENAVVEMLRDRGYTVIDGDFTKEEVLKNAAISRARFIIFAKKDDLANLMGVVTAKHINPKIRIISRGVEEYSMTKIQRAGAEICVVPEILAGVEIGNYIKSKVG